MLADRKFFKQQKSRKYLTQEEKRKLLKRTRKRRADTILKEGNCPHSACLDNLHREHPANKFLTQIQYGNVARYK